MIHTMALLLRSRLETKKSRTVERAVLQLQALVDQYRLADPSVKERQEYFYALLVPTIWELEVCLTLSFFASIFCFGQRLFVLSLRSNR
jgi:hypothetical protein